MTAPHPREGLLATSRCAVHLLGSVGLVVDGAEVPVASGRQRALLAALALEPGSVVPVDALVAAAWGGDAAPQGVHGTLRAHVSKLRSLGLGQLVEHTSGGYRLALTDDDVDARRFVHLVVQAQQGGPDATDLLDEALRLWRGPALQGAGAAPLLLARAEQLEQARRDAVELRAAAYAERGRHAEAAADLRALLVLAPTRESAAAALMRALYGSGRQAEALEVYGDVRRRLREDLGLEPGAELRRTHEEVLSQSTPPGRPVMPAQRLASPELGSDVGRGNLPVPLTSFIGRHDDLDEVRELLATNRLVTLTGAGGSGKTRLAVEVARRLPDRDVDGPWLVELAGLQDPDLVANAFAQAAGVATGERQDVVQELVDALRERPLFAVVDNCEHVADSVAVLVEQLLVHCPRLRVLATSREPLGVMGERIYVVPSLQVSGPSGDGDAVTLFVQRATAVDPSFSTDPSSLSLVRQVCTELDGIPLAIELAASRLSALPLSDIARLLDDRFALLTSRSRTALPRHRTLAAAVQWSYDLLTEEEQRLFQDVTVFRGGFSLDAAAQVVRGAGPCAELAATLSALVDKSIVVAEGSRRRYRLLETLREFGARQQDPDRAAALRHRHLAWAVEFAARAGQRLRTADEGQVSRDFVDERHNLRAAPDHAIARSSAEAAVRIVASTWWHWFTSGQISEGLRWTDRVLALPGDVDPCLTSDVFCGRSLLCHLAGDVEGSITAGQSALELAQRCDDPIRLAEATTWAGYMLGIAGRQEEAAAASAIGMATAHSSALPAHVLADCLLTSAQIARGAGHVDQAAELLEQARREAARGGDRWAAAAALWVLGKLALQTGNPRRAAAVLAGCAADARRHGDRSHTLASLHHLAGAVADIGRAEDGAVLLGAVQALGARTGVHAARMIPAESQEISRRVMRTLSRSTYDAALQRGRQLSVDEAVALGITASRST